MCRAIHLLAQTEGILLDPVYTGKAMAGLIDHVRTGRLDPASTVVSCLTAGSRRSSLTHRSFRMKVPGFHKFQRCRVEGSGYAAADLNPPPCRLGTVTFGRLELTNSVGTVLL